MTPEQDALRRRLDTIATSAMWTSDHQPDTRGEFRDGLLAVYRQALVDVHVHINRFHNNAYLKDDITEEIERFAAERGIRLGGDDA